MGRTTSEGAVDSISLRVVEELAAAAGTEPTDMEPPLFDVINPEALDRLFRPGVDCLVTFEYEDYEVEVRSDGRITIDGATHCRS